MAWRFGGKDSRARRWARMTAGSLALFGVSDVIEFYTGAWWRQMGLLVFKILCVLGIVTTVIGLARALRAGRR
ncbi:MAG: hypothetical protein ACT4QC_19715 [Planctomycetaceae bacterium]